MAVQRRGTDANGNPVVLAAEAYETKRFLVPGSLAGTSTLLEHGPRERLDRRGRLRQSPERAENGHLDPNTGDMMIHVAPAEGHSGVTHNFTALFDCGE